ncbi:MAG: ribokinase [Myxococcaceae bacterium]|nr:ribokinase [Myxococcaceae bacterium]
MAVDVLVIGGANTDFLVKGSKLPTVGETVEGDTYYSGPGGKGANQAVAAARLGAKVAFVGRVGADTRGAELVSALAAEGIDVSHVLHDPLGVTGAALVMVEGRGQKQIHTAPGANLLVTVRDVVAAADLFAEAKVVLLQLEVPQAAVETAVRLANAAGARVVLDPAPPRELPDSLLRGVHVIRPNVAEARALTGVEVHDRASAAKAGHQLRERGAKFAVVGAPGGNLLVGPNLERWFAELEIEPVDATGAGDAMAGALAAELAAGHGLEAACEVATAAAAFKTMRLGAQPGLPHRAELEVFRTR